MTFTIATLNLGDGPARAKRADLRKLIAASDIICLQEAHDRDDEIRAVLRKHPTWRVHQPYDGTGCGEVPILWDSALFDVIRLRSFLAVPERRVAAWPNGKTGKGAGPAVVGTKGVTLAVLRNKDTRERVRVLNLHTCASATRGDLPADEERARREHFADHIAKAVKIARRAPKVATVVCGDLNATAGFDLLGPLQKVIPDGWWDMPTHGSRSIDFAASRGCKRARRRTLDGFSSDHRPALVDLKIRTTDTGTYHLEETA